MLMRQQAALVRPGNSRAMSALVSLALLPVTAQAHVAVPTIALMAGAVHPWVNPDSALVLFGISLWLTQNAGGADSLPYAVNGLALAAGVASGVGAGYFLHGTAPLWIVSSVSFAVGLCIACRLGPGPLPLKLSCKLPWALAWQQPWLFAMGCVALAGGFYAGLDSAPDIKAQKIHR